MNKKTHKKCINCKEEFKLYSSLQKFCSFPCKSEYEAKKALREEEKSWAKDKAKMKEGLKKHSEYEKDLQDEINHIVRLIDKGHPCMMCGNKAERDYASHYRSVGANNSIRFHLHNIWVGCFSCNGCKGGNLNGYDVELLKHYTELQWKFIKFDIVREFQYVKLTKEELIEKTKLARVIVKSLSLKDLRYNTEERWQLRTHYNLILGIYLD